MMYGMSSAEEYLVKSDDELLAECDIHIYKASGPGGQHRNKVSSAVRFKHRPTGISATANDSRSQHTNRRLGLTRLRMNLALRLRCPALPKRDELPSAVIECIFTPKKQVSACLKRLQVGRKDRRFWLVAAYLLDWVAAAEGRLSPVAQQMGISTGNLTTVLKSDRHLLAAAQEIRRNYNQRPIS
ncbi:hypothetical protein LCGC14_2742390 [marine sediment metagenome]|uniref:Prokaryotic-type class I peptide chain release factors domain-containing protein n=1 Tax=marine sediment metagenome TaxID=412755 RepID=A0A0F8Z437_9ZZZZ